MKINKNALNLHKYIFLYKKIKKKYHIMMMKYLSCNSTEIHYIWEIDNGNDFSFPVSGSTHYSIFGKQMDLSKLINWHQDKFSDYIYPQYRIDKMDVHRCFDKGIELVFPWELSRFYFGINLFQKYVITKDKTYFDLFIKNLNNWINNNKFLYGVNWLATMEVAIRAVNWIVTLNLFSSFFVLDKTILRKLSKSLIQHAEYISRFPLIEKGGLTTNHTTSAYAGLLFLGLTLRDYPKSKKWLDQAISGLEKCLEEQVYEDGVDFEGAIPYHRLVLEFFAYSTIVAHANGIKFSENFYKKLYKMFIFSASYQDKNGNAPQIGDNDSGRLLIFNASENDPYKSEHIHSYLNELAQHIFNLEKGNTENYIKNNFTRHLPHIEKITVKDNDRLFRRKKFEKGGAYILNNEKFDFLLSCFPTGQNGKGGHNHLDMGSFTLSVNGEQVIVDPGSYLYTSNRTARNQFRSYTYHNVIYNMHDLNLDLAENADFSLKSYYSCESVNFAKEEINIMVKYINDKILRNRIFKLNGKFLHIEDFCKSTFYSRINFHPIVKILGKEKSEILTNKFKINIHSKCEYSIRNYQYSHAYGFSEDSFYIIFKTKDNLNLTIEEL